MYDVIVVGAGLAGLRAASLLAGRKLLVLESAGVAGGRVLTREQAGVSYDLGAVFASAVPAGVVGGAGQPLLPSLQGYALHTSGRWIEGDSPLACVRMACTSLGDAASQSVLAFCSGHAQLSDVHQDVAPILDAFFKVIHPFALNAALPARQRAALTAFTEGFRKNGNGELVSALRDSLPAGVIRYGADVRRVVEEGEWVRVEYVCAAGEHAVRARAVIVATPSSSAREMLKAASPEAREFLSSIEFCPGIACVVAVPADAVSEFNYRVATDLGFNTVIQCRRGNLALLHVYCLGANAEHLAALPVEHISSQIVALLVDAGVLADTACVTFADAQVWQGVGPRITAPVYGGAGLPWRLSSRLLLAGDYTWLQPEDPLPFGMAAAIASGARAAQAVSEVLFVGESPGVSPFAAPVSVQRRLEPLLASSVFLVSGNEPHFLKHVVEGDIAFYGMLLLAEPQPSLCDYLWRSAREGLWEYQAGFGVTAADSAIVMEGLYAAEGASQRLQISAQNLVRDFYCPEQGAFRTVNGGRAPYWEGVSLETTAHAAWLLLRLDRVRWQREIAACAAFVARAQHADGHWEGRWFPSQHIPTYFAARLLAECAHPDAAVRLAAAQSAVCRTQGSRGGWGGNVIDTAAAVLALRSAGKFSSGAGTGAIKKAQQWLTARLRAGGATGEPVLYYWYEEAGERRFYLARDHSGRIAHAWAALALSGRIA